MTDLNASAGEIPPNNTIYINNLNDKIKLEVVSRDTLILHLLLKNVVFVLQRIQYAKTKSDVIAKADGTFVPREKRKRHEDRGKKRKERHDPNQAPMGLNPSYAAAYGATLPLSQIPYLSNPAVPEAPAPPNNILFIQNLPHQTSSTVLQMIFHRLPGFREVRMVEAKPGIAFIEYENDVQATHAMQSLQRLKLNPDSPMLITYAKK